MEIEDFSGPGKVFTVTEITRLIKSKLEASFSQVWIEGEISSFTRAYSGHLYFTLKDESCQIQAVMWRSLAEQVPFDLDNGLQVIGKGRINVYEQRGQYQLQVEAIEPKGKGALQLAFEQLKEKLNQEGLFSPEIKKRLPMLPEKIGIVTSPRGAALVDILRTLERRFARLHILIYPAKVQGEGAAGEIVEGIDYFSSRPDVDVIIVGRGGGSIEDLWAFNEEIVARAIFRCPIPVISAVGHEIDYTITDFVADIRASTPSAAAEMVIEKEQAFIEKIENLEKRLSHHVLYMTQELKNRTLGLLHHQAFHNFKARLLNLAQMVDSLDMRALKTIRREQQLISENKSQAMLLQEKLQSILREKIQGLKGKWEKYTAELHTLSPLNIMKKGYTLCWKDGGDILVRRIEDVSLGEEMRVSFFKGHFTCRVGTIDRSRLIDSRTGRGKNE